jgi:ubiquinone/menaquinone biosynthesis C-methylase UbiE
MPDAWERYEFASNFIKGKKIIDIACGPGYGTALLSARSGKTTIGLDIEGETVLAATKNYGDITEFKKIDGYHWPIESNSFDVVVSLETFEHVDNPDAFLQEVVRVLKPTGSFSIIKPAYKPSQVRQ